MTRKKSPAAPKRRSPNVAPADAGSPARAARPKAELKVSRLEQVRVLADPLRLRMLQAFGDAPRTTKQVAELLGEKPTRLYHHVDAMARAGLIQLHHTRQNRGAVEKYFTAVARRFEVGRELFAAHGAAAEDESVAMIRAVVEAARSDVLEYFGRGHDKPPVPPMIARAAVKVPVADLAKLGEELRALLSKSQKPAKPAGEKTRPYMLTILLHPAPEERE